MDINNHNDIDNKHEPHCASEKLFRRLQKENNLFKEFNSESSLTNEHNVNEKSDINLKKLKRNDGLSRQSDNRKDKLDVVKRFKRWLPAEEVRLSQHQILYKMMSSSTFLCSINFNEELFCGGTAFWSSRLQIKRCFIQDYRSSLSWKESVQVAFHYNLDLWEHESTPSTATAVNILNSAGLSKKVHSQDCSRGEEVAFSS